MNVLLIGSGGREHAIAHYISKSPLLEELHCVKGNGGIAHVAHCHEISETDFEALLELCKQKNISLVIVGPEAPLVAGAADFFAQHDIACFGPKKAGAILEGSKDFAKQFMQRHNIPCAQSQSFTEYTAACEYVKQNKSARVIKASGLAAGKGVIVADSENEALTALDTLMNDKKFGDAGALVVIEERLYGQEASLLAFVDGNTIVPMVASQDHKRVGEGDTGLNTGGMGAYAPTPFVTPELSKVIQETVLDRALAGMQAENMDYVGVLYAGLMLTEDGPKVIEFNCRFGDPETQVVLPLLENDLLEVIVACTQHKLAQQSIVWKNACAAGVVLASGGYPEHYEKGKAISLPSQSESTVIFHAGTKKQDTQLVTNGGRVMCVSAVTPTLQQSLDAAYKIVENISFENMYYRKDIGQKAIVNVPCN